MCSGKLNPLLAIKDVELFDKCSLDGSTEAKSAGTYVFALCVLYMVQLERLNEGYGNVLLSVPVDTDTVLYMPG